MGVHIFGAACSPAVCMATMRRTAEDNRHSYSDVADLIKTNFYVDNYLDSVETEDEAIERSPRLIELLQRDGFHLTKRLSSSRMVLASFDPSELADPTLDLSHDLLPTERTLGVLWQSDSDVFVFRTNIQCSIRTKREALRNTASLFDPVGFLSPVIVRVKVFLQTVWRAGLEWDAARRMDEVATDVKVVESLEIPRCLQCRVTFVLHSMCFEMLRRRLSGLCCIADVSQVRV